MICLIFQIVKEQQDVKNISGPKEPERILRKMYGGCQQKRLFNFDSKKKLKLNSPFICFSRKIIQILTTYSLINTST